jgi:hypothetical protein
MCVCVFYAGMNCDSLTEALVGWYKEIEARGCRPMTANASDADG